MPVDTSIIIPVYNAAGILTDSVHQVIAVMDSFQADYEILLCDDASTDQSGEALKQLGSQCPRVKSYYNSSNKGLGFTLRRLLKEAKGKNIIYCDCDLPFGADVLPVLLKKLENRDIVVASRYRGASNGTPFARKACSRLYYLLCKLLFHIPVADIGSGTVAMRRQALKNADLKADGFDIHVEFYWKMSKQGARIEEVPVKFNPNRQKGSFRIWGHGPGVLVKTLKLYCGSLKRVRVQ
ncbi:MAG: glycosyltransferase family 2 protein [Candidatus Omnitrophica bacterium]|nr:glycosyltransferase family 2 protein [Candidatus Omnitrophota bacterium]